VQSALVDGFIVHCLEDGDRLIAMVRMRNLPFVALDLGAGPGVSSVLVADRDGAYQAARHLLGLGHRKIGILMLEVRSDGRHGWVDAERLRQLSYKVERERVAGYRRALSEEGIELDRLPIIECPNEIGPAADYAGQLLDREPDTTAILAMSDILALAAIEAARARGIRVPEDLSVIGFDGIPESAASDPPLTTIAQPIRAKGRRAAELIFHPGPPRTEILDVTLIERASTAPAQPRPRTSRMV
jgi:DNA-binding LacI/PurR family transcriptional regulator